MKHNTKKTLVWTTALLSLVALFGFASMAVAGQPKVTICHIPPGNPDNAHEISVGAPAVPAHLAHGDVLGTCGGGDGGGGGGGDGDGGVGGGDCEGEGEGCGTGGGDGEG